MPGIIGKKIGMTSVFTENGNLTPVTVIQAGPCQVVNVRTVKKDGYEAIALGYGVKKDKHLAKAQKVYFEKNNLTPASVIKEFKNFDSEEEHKIGDTVNVDLFEVGEIVKVTGVSKGKGFQGVMRRHNFSGVGGATHGQKDRLRAPGSIGQSSYPSRVFKGTRMAGRMGNDKSTTSGLEVIKVVPEENVIMVKGNVPGSVNSIVQINK